MFSVEDFGHLHILLFSYFMSILINECFADL